MIGEVVYPDYRVVVTAGIIVLLAGLMPASIAPRLGLRLRASIDNVEMAALMGVRRSARFALVFAVATALAVLAGALVRRPSPSRRPWGSRISRRRSSRC